MEVAPSSTFAVRIQISPPPMAGLACFACDEVLHTMDLKRPLKVVLSCCTTHAVRGEGSKSYPLAVLPSAA